MVAVLVVASLASGLLPWRLQRIASGSMAPTLAVGDLVLVAGADPVVGTVVVVHDPTGGPDLVKRVVAVGGQVVEIIDGVLVVDGRVACDRLADRARTDGDQGGPWAVPAGSVFLLGDARAVSVDSRDFGPVALDQVVGTVTTRVWPGPGGLPAPGC